MSQAPQLSLFGLLCAVLCGSVLLTAGCNVQPPTAATNQTDVSPPLAEIATQASVTGTGDDTLAPADEPDSAAPETDTPATDISVKDGSATEGPVTDDTATNDTVAAAPPRRTALSFSAGGVQKITFDDLKLEIKEDMKYDPKQLTEIVRNLEGKMINVTGYIHPGSTFKQKGITQFILIRNLECKFGPGGQMHHNVRVQLRDGLTTSFTNNPVSVEGILSIDPFNDPVSGFTYSIYTLDAIKVK